MRSARRWCLRASRPSCWQAGGTRITRPSACGGRATSLALFIRGGEGNPHDVLLANLLQGSRSTLSCTRFPSVFAFQEGVWTTQISALLGSPTVPHEPGLSTAYRNGGAISSRVSGGFVRQVYRTKRSIVRQS